MGIHEKIRESIKKEFQSLFNILEEEPIVEYNLGAEITLPNQCEFSERNPITNVEIWKYKGITYLKNKWALIKRQEKEKTAITFKEKTNYSNIYGVLRSEYTNLIRNKLSEIALCSIHASCVNIKNKSKLIIGGKGTGKSSASIYLHQNGGEIYTDELVFINKDGYPIFLPRLVGVDQLTLYKYFPDYKNKVWGEVNSIHNTEKKLLLDIVSGANEKIKIDEVILLIKGDPTNVSILDKIELLSEQWVTYDKGKRSEKFLREIISKAQPMNLEQFREKIYG